MTVPASPVVRINGGPAWDSRFSVFVLAGQEVTIESEAGAMAQKWEGDGQFVRVAPGSVSNAGSVLTWRAPETPGTASLALKTTDEQGNWVDGAHLNFQVMAPSNQLVAGRINGYRIGKYPKPDDSLPEIYQPPAGFLKLSETAGRTPISPRFNLEDFACKEPHTGDCYVALQQKLLPFLEAIATMVEQKGFACREGAVQNVAVHQDVADNTLQGAVAGRPIIIMSGYRTPAYNSTLGTAERSRHQYGDASDIIIDADGDGNMDDLNKDGKVDGQDALTLAAWIEDLWTRPEFVNNPGGLGVYNANGEHGPFVHVDLRGKRARWGGNGLEWNDEAVGQAGSGAVVELASVEKPAAPKIVKATRPARKRGARIASSTRR